MYKVLHPREDVDILYVSRKQGGRGLTKIQHSVVASMQRLEDCLKTQRETDNSDKKQFRQHKHQQNKNKRKTKIRRKTIVWTFQATNERNLTRENLDMTKKEKRKERN